LRTPPLASANWTRATALAVICFFELSAARNGSRVYRNGEFAISAQFPAGARVCEARSGDHPHGFYAWLGGRLTDCHATVPDPAVRAISIYASYNASFQTSAASLLPCPGGGAPRGRGVDVRGLSLRGLPSIRCITQQRDGTIEIAVAARGGRWASHYRSAEFRAGAIDYVAALDTRPERLAGDLVLFRAFLSRLEIRRLVMR
jgi:hypothetical protein